MTHANLRTANRTFRAGLVGFVLVSVFTACGTRAESVSQAAKQDVAAGLPLPSIKETTRIAEQAYIYGFPMIAAYKALYQFNVDKSSPQFKVGFNQVWNDAKTFTIEGPPESSPIARMLFYVRSN